jgi:hypothetical protein
MRLILIGILMLGVDYVLTDSSRPGPYGGDILERWLAERVVATGEIKVSAQSDERVQAAFKRARAAQPAESTLPFVEANDHGRKYEVWLMAPKRDQALAQLEALLAKFRDEYRGEFGRDLWTFSSPYVPPVRGQRMASMRLRVNLGLLLPALGALAAGAWLFWQAPPAARARMIRMLRGTEKQ